MLRRSGVSGCRKLGGSGESFETWLMGLSSPCCSEEREEGDSCSYDRKVVDRKGEEEEGVKQEE